jgi:lysophospholipase L1-like esterase
MDGPAEGQVFQVIEGGGGRAFTVGGLLKTQGSLTACVALQSFAAGGETLDFLRLAELEGSQDWTAFRKRVWLSDRAERFALLLRIAGYGRAWLDEVWLAGEGVRNEAFSPLLVLPPLVQDPLVPVHGGVPFDPDAFLSFHQRNLRQAARGDAEVVLLGDSLTHCWELHRNLWEERFGAHRTINLGIGGDRTQQVLWRIEKGTLDGLSPRLVVILIGINNVVYDYRNFGAARIAQGIRQVVRAVQAKCPRAKVLLLGIFPTGNDSKDPWRIPIREINALSAQLDDGRMVRFLDIGKHFLREDGSMIEGVSPDGVHLTLKGYRIWADAMQPLLEEMLRQ